MADALAMAVERAAAALRAARRVVVAGHVDPDGDALGSAVAITAGLRTLGVDAVATWGARDDGEAPAGLDPALAAVLPAAALLRDPLELLAEDPPDVLVACDTAALRRLGTARALVERAATTVVVDHHVLGDGFGDVRVVDPAASCTGVLALRLLDALEVDLTPGMASALYLALLTDTGRFGHASTTPRDHLVAARLIEAGADHVGVARAVYASASRGYLPLVARVTGRAVVENGLVASWVTQADLAETGAAEHEPDGLIDLLRSVGDVDVACFLRETRSGTWRGSLRSSGGTDVAAVAARFGGGGHRLAAGFPADGDPAEVLAEVRRHLADAPGPLTPSTAS